jgi:hypothetical protein
MSNQELIDQVKPIRAEMPMLYNIVRAIFWILFLTLCLLCLTTLFRLCGPRPLGFLPRRLAHVPRIRDNSC